MGLKFRSSADGSILAIRYWKPDTETGTHNGFVWSSAGLPLARVKFSGESSSGWQEQQLEAPLGILANTTYIVSVNANTGYVATRQGFSAPIINGPLISISDGSNGSFDNVVHNFPTFSFQAANYFRDVVFAAGNVAGSVSINGSTTEGGLLTATISDYDGLNGGFTYQWQESSDSGSTWDPIVGETNQTITLNSGRVGKLIRATATYNDLLSNPEFVISSATSPVVPTGQISVLTTQQPGGFTTPAIKYASLGSISNVCFSKKGRDQL